MIHFASVQVAVDFAFFQFVDKLHRLIRLHELVALFVILDGTAQLIVLRLIRLGFIGVVGVKDGSTHFPLHPILVDSSMDDVCDILLFALCRLILVVAHFHLVPSVQIVLGTSECYV